MNKYDVTATIDGESANEVISKLMTASYILDFEMDELQVALAQDQGNVLFFEDGQWDGPTSAPTDNDPNEVFNFPHVKTLIEGLQERKRNDRRG